MLRILTVPLIVLVLVTPGLAGAQNAQIIAQDRDSRGHGITVLHVWGSHSEMGYAIGATLAEEILESVYEIRDYMGTRLYPEARAAAQYLRWPEGGLETEMEAMVQGIHDTLEGSETEIDLVDIHILNSMSDLPYLPGVMCRSHSAWGRFTEEHVEALHSRRFDYSALIDSMHHHVLVAMEPDSGVRWVNYGWAGMLSLITGVNEDGTLVALHNVMGGDASLERGWFDRSVPRSAAARSIATEAGYRPLSDQASWASYQIDGMNVMTDTFIPFYVRDGSGGAFDCEDGDCSLVAAQPDFLFGEAVITTNWRTDGHSTPYGGDWLAEYYGDLAPKTLESHWDVTDDTGDGLHRLSVEVRGQGDMTLWFDGGTLYGRTARQEIEWSELWDRPEGDDGRGDVYGDFDKNAATLDPVAVSGCQTTGVRPRSGLLTSSFLF